MLIWITGASAGFGQAMARQFVARGHRVVGMARRAERLHALQRELGEAFYPLVMDVAQTADIGKTLATLPAEWREPDVLVNLTNDGWFWGSSELDMHLVCGVFRAVECRKPFLIAANTGISAWIDANGRIVCRGPKRKTDTLLAEVAPDDLGAADHDLTHAPSPLPIASNILGG